MSRKPYDELPWWCQLLWPWFGPPWYQQVEDLDAYLAAYWCALHLSAAELAELLAGDDPPGEGYLAKAARLTAARRQAEEIISHEYGQPAKQDEDDGDEDDGDEDEQAADRERPMVMDRDHPSWAEVDAEQRERIGDPPCGMADHDCHEPLGVPDCADRRSRGAVDSADSYRHLVSRRRPRCGGDFETVPIGWPAALVIACVLPRRGNRLRCAVEWLGNEQAPLPGNI